MEQTPQSLIDALLEFEKIKWDAWAIRRHAEGFSNQRFHEQLRNLVEREWARFQVRQKSGHDSMELTEKLLAHVEGARLSDISPTDDGLGEQFHDVVP